MKSTRIPCRLRLRRGDYIIPIGGIIPIGDIILRCRYGSQAAIDERQENQNRDQVVNSYLVDKDWKVLRFWSYEIRKNLNLCIKKIEATLDRQKNA